MFPHQVPAVKPQPEAVFPQLRLSPSVASPPWLHSMRRQMQGCILFLPPKVSRPSESRLCHVPDIAQKSEVGRRGRKKAKRKKMKMKRNCTTTDFFHSVSESMFASLHSQCCLHMILSHKFNAYHEIDSEYLRL